MASQGRVAWVTGASGGIGRATALALARAGADVVLGYHRNETGVAETQHLIEEAVGNVRVLAVRGDVGQPEDVERQVEAIEREFGRVDILVHNAGIALAKLLIDMTVDEWDTMMAVHLRGAFMCSRAVLPGMLRRRFGRIINVTSMWGQVGTANEVAYSAAKAGLIGFTKALAQEVGRGGVTVNAVAPGVIDTPMIDDYGPEDRAALVDRTPVARIGTPYDVARAVVWLADDEAEFVTGQVVAPNGGIVV